MAKHQDREWLYEQYVELERRPADIAEECGIHPDTVIYWRDKFGFPKVDHSSYWGTDYDEPYHDKEWLREKYWDEGFDTTEIGEMCEVSKETIRRWLHKHDLGTRDRSEWVAHQWEKDPNRPPGGADRGSHVSIFTRKRGYVYAGCGVCGEQVAMHRLLAVAEYGFDVVIGMDIHHKNRIPWDNRPANIEPLTRSDHMRSHRLQEA